MNEIISARNILSTFINDSTRSIYEFKRHAIGNSLYGVDIDPGAVEIAKLRLWLSLIVDEEDIDNIRPLPNLDYKIMQGNSLLEEYEGIKLIEESFFEDEKQKAKELEALEQKQNELSKEYLGMYQNNSVDVKKRRWIKNERYKKKIDKLKDLHTQEANKIIVEKE